MLKFLARIRKLGSLIVIDELLNARLLKRSRNRKTVGKRSQPRFTIVNHLLKIFKKH